jgi:hypothetical protein
MLYKCAKMSTGIGQIAVLVAIAFPGSRGLFSWMQETLKHRSDNRIRLTTSVHDCLRDFQLLKKDLTTRPTRLFEIVPQDIPVGLGTSSACGHVGGLLGAHFPGHLPPPMQSTPLQW